MSLANLLADKFGAPALLAVMQEELPISVEILDALAPAIPRLCAVLQKHGIKEVAGIDVAEFIEAVARDAVSSE